jgi:colicin import membrane protein
VKKPQPEEQTAAIAKFNETEAGLALLRERYGATKWVITDTASLDAAKQARADVRDVRFALEHARKARKENLLDASRRIDAEAKRLTAAILEIETPIDEAVKAEERRREDERLAKQRAEQQRVADLAKRITDIRYRVASVAHQTAEAIAEELADLRELAANPGDFQEMQAVAEQAITETLERVTKLHADAVQREAEVAQVREQQAEIRRLKERLAEAERKQKEEADAQRLKTEAGEAKLRAEREALEAEQRKQAEERRKAEEAELATKRAEEQRARERMDARQMLETFRRRFGGIKEFALVTKAINQVLGDTEQQGRML